MPVQRLGMGAMGVREKRKGSCRIRMGIGLRGRLRVPRRRVVCRMARRNSQSTLERGCKVQGVQAAQTSARQVSPASWKSDRGGSTRSTRADRSVQTATRLRSNSRTLSSYARAKSSARRAHHAAVDEVSLRRLKRCGSDERAEQDASRGCVVGSRQVSEADSPRSDSSGKARSVGRGDRGRTADWLSR